MHPPLRAARGNVIPIGALANATEPPMNRAVEAIKRIIPTVGGGDAVSPLPHSHAGDSMPLRPWVMPSDATQAASVHRMWDARNGRYYLTADVVLENGTFLRDVTFDGDSRVAVEVGLAEFPAYFGKRIVDFFTVADCATGTFRFRAEEERRTAFGERQRG